MRINQLEQLNKSKIRVSLDNGETFALYTKEVHALGLEEEMELEDRQWQEILQEILISRAKRRTMHLLEKMDRTEHQLREKLRLDLYPQEVIDIAISYVESFHYIDDQRYAQSYVRYHGSSKSKRQLQMELHQKGLSKDQIVQALEEEYQTEDEAEKIEKWLQKKHYDQKNADQKEKQRMYQFLMRKGFQSEDILRKL